MAPKRKAQNKKRQTKSNNNNTPTTPNTNTNTNTTSTHNDNDNHSTPIESPPISTIIHPDHPISSISSSPTIQDSDHHLSPSLNRPIQSTNSNSITGDENDSDHHHLSKPINTPLPPSAVMKTAPSESDLAPLSQRSVNLPSSKPNSINSSDQSNSDRPTKTILKDPSHHHTPSKPTSDLHHLQTPPDSTNLKDSTVNPKSDSEKFYHLLNNHSNGIDQLIDIRPASLPQRSIEPILLPPSNHSHISNGSSNRSEPSEPREIPSIGSQDGSLKSLANSGKKPTKHVKFTNSTNDEFDDHSTRAHHHLDQNHFGQPGFETEDPSRHLLTKQKTIRRELSGAADQFDFDAQQRQQAGPGGGIVKKPRHQQPSNCDSVDDPHLASSEPSPGSSDGGSRDFVDRTLGSGVEHARRCLRSAIVRTQYFAPQTELDPNLFQTYLSYFDRNQDGRLDPLDTWRAFRLLGFGLLVSTTATLMLHAILTPFIGLGWWLIPDVIGRCQLPVTRHFLSPSRHSLQVDPNRFSNGKDRSVCKIGPLGLWKKTRDHMGVAEMTDPVGWLKFIFGWTVAICLTWPSDLSVEYSLIDGVYNGELFFLVAEDVSSSSS